ncbi:hypothetical protein ACHAXA_002880 [Cyclostephanos tholiformis]|uniref:Uncharacterized protein n=1 Tax=Cyclostephanos tholiformis TaxID=382380 RepID=A0ABD3SG53_9STRA
MGYVIHGEYQMDSLPAAERIRKCQKENIWSSPAAPSSSSSSSPSPSPSLRRLAPQRKKTSITSAVNTLPPIEIISRVDHGEAVANSFNERFHSHDDDDDHDEVEHGLQKSIKNVADWIETDYRIYNSTGESGESEVEDEGEDDEEEYHGEIESIASIFGSKFAGEFKEDEEMDSFIQIVTEEHLPLYPLPPTSPLVLVNLETLTGCMPKNEADKSLLLRQLLESLLGFTSNNENGDISDLKHERKEQTSMLGEKGTSMRLNVGDGLSLDFEERVMELFESGVAIHIDSSHPIARSCMMMSLNDLNEMEEETGIFEMDRDEKAQVHPYAIVPYPEFLVELQQEQRSTKTTRKFRSSLRLWKLIHTTPSTTATPTSQYIGDIQMSISHLLSRIFSHLRNCSRSLIWKANMHIELCHLAKVEYTLQIERQRILDYTEWKETVRRSRLDELYDVRETFQVQVSAAKKKYDLLAQEREKNVGIELLRRRRQRGEKSGVSFCSIRMNSNDADKCCDDGSDWGRGAIFEDDILGDEVSFVGQSQLGAMMQIDKDVNDDEVSVDENNEEDKNDEWSPLEVSTKPSLSGMQIVLDRISKNTSYENDGNTEIKEAVRTEAKNTASKKITLEPISRDDNRRRLLRRRNRQEEKRTPACYDASTATTNERRREYLKKEEVLVREMLKTNDERIAEATLLKLEERLQNVDELLESLQEEEWADDEDGDDQEDSEGGNERVDDEFIHSQATEFPSLVNPTLLDHILAMILGALPEDLRCLSLQKAKNTNSDHYRYLKEEHESIAKEWIRIFGRLPPLQKIFPEKIESKEKISVDGNKLDYLPFGDDFTFSEANIVFESDGNLCCDADLGKDFTPIDNDDSNWDEVADWDALFP